MESADKFLQGLMAEILRFAQDDSLFCLAMMEGEQASA